MESKVQRVTVRGYVVELVSRGDNPPHGFETLRDGKLHACGGLDWHGKTLDGLEGCAVLPLCVADALTGLGYTVDTREFCGC